MDYNAKIRRRFFLSKRWLLLEILSTHWRHLGELIFCLISFMHYWLLKKETKFESIYNIIKTVWTPHSIVAEFIWDGVNIILQRGKPRLWPWVPCLPLSCLLHVTAEVSNIQSNQKVNEDFPFGLNIFIFNSLKPHLCLLHSNTKKHGLISRATVYLLWNSALRK